MTPEGADAQVLETYMKFWRGLGALVEQMEPDHHDLVLAVTSHAPHLIAYTMVGVADDLQRVTDSEVVTYSAAGFRDFTRIAASDPTMWRDVFLTNKEATLEILGRFTEELFALQRAIRQGDGDHLHAYFTRTRAIRRGGSRLRLWRKLRRAPSRRRSPNGALRSCWECSALSGQTAGRPFSRKGGRMKLRPPCAGRFAACLISRGRR